LPAISATPSSGIASAAGYTSSGASARSGSIIGCVNDGSNRKGRNGSAVAASAGATGSGPPPSRIRSSTRFGMVTAGSSTALTSAATAPME